ncbi:ATP-binding protein [Mucilaginibacter rubeus]|uniref:ATP-binding protein n=1 Tax=Mucilaginibacter rubeus TaxID=2027860 RepID=UPI001FB59399|nr:ATP-binding protein [Mucilaginibacter rubeus]
MNTSTLDKLRKMKFFGMFHAFKSSMETGKTNDYTADELLAHLVDAEWDDRQNRRIERTILYARSAIKLQLKMFTIMLTEVLTATRSCAWRIVRLLTASRTC